MQRTRIFWVILTLVGVLWQSLGLAPVRAGGFLNNRAPTSEDIPLMRACIAGNTNEVTKLLKRASKREVNATERYQGWTSLFFACEKGREELVALLLAHGAEANYTNTLFHTTPLILAAQGGYTSIVQRLLQAGADVNNKDIAGRTALSYAHGRKDQGLETILLQAGAQEIKVKMALDEVTLQDLEQLKYELQVVTQGYYDWIDRNLDKFKGGYVPTWQEVAQYLDQSLPFCARNGCDMLGNPIIFSKAGSRKNHVLLSDETLEALKGFTGDGMQRRNFWGNFCPLPPH
jgi:hypothetical protein